MQCVLRGQCSAYSEVSAMRTQRSVQCVLRGSVRAGGEGTQTAQKRVRCRRRHRRWHGRAPLPYAVRVTCVSLGVGVACMVAARADVLQLSTSSVLASVGCAGLAGSSAGFAVAASLVSRVPPATGEGPRSSTCTWVRRTGA
eukprot:6187613-Pleurochrysis_carterae.AAC.2